MGVLDGRVAICTGSGRGVGAEVAKLMAKEGASVIVNDPGVSGGGEGGEQGPAETIANEIKAGGGTMALAEVGNKCKKPADVKMKLKQFITARPKVFAMDGNNVKLTK